MYEGLMISVSGVRGRVAGGLTPEIVGKFAAGFGAWASRDGNRNVVVGRDSRVSGPMFHRATVAGLQSVGCNVIDVGMAPTPTIQLAVEHHGAAGGLAITASHNPIEWNALKFIGASGLFLDDAEGKAMRAVVESDFARASWEAIGSVREDAGAIAHHIDRVLSLRFLDVERIRARRFRVALDCVRGAGGVIMPELLERLGCDVSPIYLETTGIFPREPEPTADHLGELEHLVRRTGSDVGFATDPDVDRLALVSDAGVAIGEDWTLALAARVVLRHRRGVVVANLSTSRILDDIVTEAGSRVIRAPVGEVNVATRMRAENAPIGGEGNGGVIFPELHFGRDAPLAVALVLQMMAEDAEPLSATLKKYPSYVIVKEKLPRPNAPLDRVYAALQARFTDAEIDTQDGLRLAWQDRWVHVRPSGTEPIVRVIAEAPSDAEARSLVKDCREPLDKLE